MTACPLCHGQTRNIDFDGVNIDVCELHGAWLDHGELVRITEVERRALGSFVWADLFRDEIRPPRDERRDLACPRCDKPMLRELYHEVLIDWCPAHGVWLDRGELAAILNNLRLDPSFLRGIRVRIADARY